MEEYLSKDKKGKSDDGFHDAGRFDKATATALAKKNKGKAVEDYPPGKWVVLLKESNRLQQMIESGQSSELIIETLSEGTYDDFTNDDDGDLRNVRKDWRSFLSDIKRMKVSEEAIDYAAEVASKYVSGIYDKENAQNTFYWFEDNKTPSIREIANVAIEVNNRYGTEMQMTVQCMDDFINQFNRGLREAKKKNL